MEKEKVDIYRDIIERTGGDIYLGVVGPVRTGKSTFIKKFMETIVLPNVNETSRERAKDELPQSSGGRTIMTTEPKFIPEEAVEVTIRDNISMRVRLVDCVGYMVPGAAGYEDDQGPRMVTTPWYDYDIPFEEAAEVGTRKVISDHSTIGLVVTTDGTITDIPRESYVDAEERVIAELKEIDKPFVIILNSTQPWAQETFLLKEEIQDKYGVPVISLSCLYLTQGDIDSILQEVLLEFPVKQVSINLPSWVEALYEDHWLRESFNDAIRENVAEINKLRDIDLLVEKLRDYNFVESVKLTEMDLGSGEAFVEIFSPGSLYDQILSEICGETIEDKADLLRIMKEYSLAKREYDKLAEALEDVREGGYGIVPPVLEEMVLNEPEIFKQGNRFGVRLKASAPSLHLIKVDVISEFSPIVGSEKQSEDLVNFLMEEYEENPEKIWESNIFGKSLHALVRDGISGKLSNMPPNAQEKLQETLSKIINEGSGGLIAIIL
ncbi:MAG: stage IV sporulation protein A [Candidatus Syntrophonatronum acetioxidans]|uniref:Stage IV sporulation protein A n=1 Tax=Candidatus Syntrophonatronum acetioxidans TaxID=1795816 RepID=A0A424YCV2_9FIRM|nr:MAG: stage IV sporulation protein A [Candidatus Syntrophonatronum acetioxidans]